MTRLFVKASIVAGFLILSFMANSADLASRQSALKSIQAQINQQQNSLKDTAKQREKLVALLKSDEQAIAKAAQKVNQSQASLAAVNTKLRELDKQQVELASLKSTQQELLNLHF